VTLGSLVREHWEVAAAAAILIGVLIFIDAASLGEPVLALSLLPLVFLVTAAFVPLTPRRAGIWIGCMVLLAFATREIRYAGLAYPALIVWILLIIHRARQNRA